MRDVYADSMGGSRVGSSGIDVLVPVVCYKAWLSSRGFAPVSECSLDGTASTMELTTTALRPSLLMSNH